MADEKKPETALAVRKGKAPARLSLGPATFEEACRFADMVAKSELAPKDYRGKPTNCLIAFQMGAEVGLAPMQSLQNIAVINGRPSLYGDAALAVCQNHKAYEWHKEWIEGTGDAKTAWIELKRKGSEPYRVGFSVAQAKKASLWGKQGPWSQYEDRMLQMRARGFGLRDKFADALRGLITAEEAQDIPADGTRQYPATVEASVSVQPALPERPKGNGSQEYYGATPDWKLDGEELNCFVYEVQRKTKKNSDVPYLLVTWNAVINGKSGGFCFDTALFDAVWESKGKQVTFQVKQSGEFVNIVGVVTMQPGATTEPQPMETDENGEPLPF